MKQVTIIVLVLAILVIGVTLWLIVGGRQYEPPVQQSPSENSTSKVYALNEVATHNTKDDCWTIISSNVYDLTKYINRHPGGEEIVRACGQDATVLFTERRTSDGSSVGSGLSHSSTASEQLAGLKIGTLAKT